MFIAAQVVSVLTILFSAWAILTNNKFKSMLLFTFANITLLVTYLLLGRYLACILIAGAILRTIIFALLAKYNIKPHWLILLAFEVYFIVVSVFLWKDAFDLFMIFNLCIVTYVSWQDNMTILRIGYILSALLIISYNSIVGAYVGIISEVIGLISTIISMCFYDRKEGKSENKTPPYEGSKEETCQEKEEKEEKI